MKKERRQELKTNELSVYLEQAYEAVQQYATYIIGGIVAVVLVLVIALVVQRNRHASEQLAWSTYYNLRSQMAQVDASLISQARALAQDHGGEAEFGPRAMELEADLHYRLAMTGEGLPTAERVEHLNKAKAIYERVIGRYGKSLAAAAGAQMSLAATLESLYVLGEGQLDVIRETYTKIIDGPENPFQVDAQQQLETLDERTRRLALVATRPAEETATQTPTTPIPQVEVLKDGSPTDDLKIQLAPAESESPATPPAQTAPTP